MVFSDKTCWGTLWLIYLLREYITWPLEITVTKTEQRERMFPTVSSEKWILKCMYTMTFSTKISLHVDKDSRSQGTGKAALCEGIFSSNVIVGHICGFCLASSHSPFFCNILLIFLWGTTSPSLSTMWMLWMWWIWVYSPLQAWPPTALYLPKHSWFKDMHTKSTSQANWTPSRDFCSCCWVAFCLCLSAKQVAQLLGAAAGHLCYSKERVSLKMSLTEKQN